jgi:hypothetical protein
LPIRLRSRTTHDLSNIKRSASAAADAVGRKIVGDAAGLEFRLYPPQCLDHFGPEVPRQQRQHVAASYLNAERARFGGKQLVKGFGIDFRSLEFGPCVF